jgi:hypothetical protein
MSEKGGSMAKRIFLKIWSILITSLALFGADVASQSKNSHALTIPSLWQLPVKRQNKPELFLQQAASQGESILVAAHRSHSSHRSHASHASHVSGVSSSPASPTSPKSSPDSTESKSVPSPVKSVAPANTGSKKVFMTNGATIACDSNWLSEGKVYFTKDGKTYSLPLEDVDLRKTSIGKGQ